MRAQEEMTRRLAALEHRPELPEPEKAKRQVIRHIRHPYVITRGSSIQCSHGSTCLSMSPACLRICEDQGFAAHPRSKPGFVGPTQSAILGASRELGAAQASQRCMQVPEGHEAAGPEDTARAARKVWELREQMTQQAAHHRRVSGTTRLLWLRPPPVQPTCFVIAVAQTQSCRSPDTARLTRPWHGADDTEMKSCLCSAT